MSTLTYKRLATIALVVAITLGCFSTTFAAGAFSTDPSAALGSVKITGSSYAELKQIDLLPDQSGKLAVFTIILHNEGNNELMIMDYWARLKSKSGNQFTARMLPQDKDKDRVAPGSSTDITFYAKVNESTNLQDLVIQLIKGDFSQANFERVLGEIAIPDAYSNTTAVGDSHRISVSGTDIKVTVSKLVSNKNEKYHVPTVYLTFENSGTQSVLIPTYLFSIRTAEGLLYPLEAKGLQDRSIRPKESKEVQLSGSIPISVSIEDWQLVITEKAADIKFNLPIGVFQLPAVSRQDDSYMGKEYSFADKSGVYSTQLNALYRLPWEDQDILTADLVLLNKGPESLPIPALFGYFLLDEAVKIDAKVVQTEKVIGLGVGDKVGFQLVGKIPYTLRFSKIKLVLQEKQDVSDAPLTDLLEFTSQSELQPVAFFNKYESYTLNDTGRKTEFKVISVGTYKGQTGDLFTAQIEATNKEKRYTNLPKLVAHFRADDGTVFPASIEEIKNKIGPSGKALLHVYATLPASYSKENMQLLIGEAVTEGLMTEGDKKADSYVKPAAFRLPEEKEEVKDKLTGVKLHPYTITINRIGTTIENSKLTLKFDYEITKDLLIEGNREGHKLVIVFEDSKGRKSFERAFETKDIEAVDTVSDVSTDTSKLKLGKHENSHISVTDAELIYKQEFLKQYSLSLYDEFQNQRKLLATQKADWFIYTD
ncbi:hypothetical protein [Paenibacillus sp. N3.4]|uniref:hypothetical protein n=1 Tax=Paenibacillus sp. N3.4 TaxID=2603222 RepID=UPI0011CB4CE5|nr:hypothetical protein [Paenibacillus sp. N3.4]TXK84839.1 hypothetical protein FU659_07235 [Paenibacillus sp. N3.4]